MPKASEITKCVDCEKEFLRKLLNRNRRCPDCSSRKIRAVITQLHNKSGLEYENWKKSMKNGIGRL